jgi:hypothetical protein
MAIPTLGSQVSGGGEDWIARAFADLRRELTELRAARTLEAATIGAGGITVRGGQIVIQDVAGNVLDTLDANGLTVSGGSVTINNGNLVVTGTGLAESGNFVAGTSGWALRPDGNAEFNDLTLRGGIIGNDALTNPTYPAAQHADATNFALPLVLAEKVRTTFTVPSGFTKALVFAATQMNAVNTTANPDYCFLSTSINGSSPAWSAGTLTAAGAFVGISSPAAALLTSLTGGSTFYVAALASSQTAIWPANANNTVNVDATVTFWR